MAISNIVDDTVPGGALFLFLHPLGGGLARELQDPNDKYPELPYELVQMIFEETARMNRASIPRLLRVARRVKKWVEPFLYSTVIRRSPASGPKGYSPPLDRLAEYAHHVRHLLVYFTPALTLDELIQHLTLCSNLIDTALWLSYPDSEPIALALSSLPLQRFSGHLSFIAPSTNRQPDRSRLTYLDILDLGSTWSRLEWLKDLRKLTHLAFMESLPKDVVQNILENCKNIQELKLLDYGIKYEDRRVISVPGLTIDGYANQWLSETLESPP